MPKLDVIHGAVKNALIKDGWTITADPYRIEYEEITVYADLAAEQPFAAERGEQRIVVEVKSFIGASLVHELEIALGQYRLYLRLLEATAPEKRLYLAVSKQIYDKFFRRKGVQFIIQEEELLMLVVDTETEEIFLWIN